VAREIRGEYKDALKTLEKGIESKDFAPALIAFEAIEKKQPNLSGPRTNIGIIYMHQEKFEAFSKALEINNENEFAHNNLGLCYRELGKFKESKASYEKAIALNPRYPDPHYNLGVLAELYLNDLELAVLSFERYKLAHRKKDQQVDIWLTDLRNRLAAERKAKADAEAAAQAQADQAAQSQLEDQAAQPQSETENSEVENTQNPDDESTEVESTQTTTSDISSESSSASQASESQEETSTGQSFDSNTPAKTESAPEQQP
jgi:tetratricopeptide (TPR) repeat protein